MHPWLLPRGVDASAGRLLVARALRGFADGYVAVLLPAYLLALGFGQFDVGLLSSTTLAGSAFTTLLVGVAGHRWPPRRLLGGAALLMIATGAAFAGLSAFWPLLLVAFVGTLNPSSGDVSVFLPLEHARLAQAAHGEVRVALFARYSVYGAGCAALGALAGGGHPLSVLVAFIVAPLKPFRPGVPSGAVSAATELWLHRPRVADFDSLRDDVIHWTGWWRNRVSRTLLVFMLTCVGTIIGEYIAAFHIIKSLF
jgi:MFS family permease